MHINAMQEPIPNEDEAIQVIKENVEKKGNPKQL